jgi:hypothetical protein
MGGAARSSGGVFLRISRRRTARYVGFDYLPMPFWIRPFNGAPLHRYPLSLGTYDVREYGHGQARRLALETRVVDGRANGGWRVQSLADFLDMYIGITITKSAGE